MDSPAKSTPRANTLPRPVNQPLTPESGIRRPLQADQRHDLARPDFQRDLLQDSPLP
jgi:hypothetical protein